MIYPVDNAIQRLNNRGQHVKKTLQATLEYNLNAVTAWLYVTHADTLIKHLINGLFNFSLISV